jgi:nicotinamidase-related amidase
MADGLSRALDYRTLHVCVDMQRIFSAQGIWPTPWMDRVLPIVTALAERHPARTIFTRFITPERADQMPGTWRLYYEKWRAATGEHVDPAMLELMPGLARLVPPAQVIDKMRYSAFFESALLSTLIQRKINSLVITGSETDVCVAATVIDAVDLGFRVILVRDAVCSSSDEGHDAALEVYHRRFSEQIETADCETVLAAWGK